MGSQRKETSEEKRREKDTNWATDTRPITLYARYLLPGYQLELCMKNEKKEN